MRLGKSQPWFPGRPDRRQKKRERKGDRGAGSGGWSLQPWFSWTFNWGMAGVPEAPVNSLTSPLPWPQSSVSAGLSHRTWTQESWATSGTGCNQDFLPLPGEQLFTTSKPGARLQIDRSCRRGAPSLRQGVGHPWGVPRACCSAIWLSVRLTGNFSSFFVSTVDLLFLEGCPQHPAVGDT